MPRGSDRDAMCEFTVIGISDAASPRLDEATERLIRSHRIFSGGRRHRQIVEPLLPPGAEWIDVTVPLAAVFERYRQAAPGARIAVFASGDPLFFGFAATLQREFPDAQLRVIPTFNSLQMLAHRITLPYESMQAVSLTGRPWSNLDTPLIAGTPLIGVLTDRLHTPAAIGRRMADYGYTNYTLTVGECLGNPQAERITVMTPEEAAGREFGMPNCVILRLTGPRPRPFGIPESDFELLDGRVNMITKMPVRLMTLSMLDLRSRHSLWDIGFCTGSVSIEARLQFPSLAVTAFERRPEGLPLIEANARRHGTPGITAVVTDFMEADLTPYPRPDAVFIGGHGGHLADMLARVAPILLHGGTVVFNSVSHATLATFRTGAAAAGLTVTDCHTLTLDGHNPITIIKAIK